MDATVENNSSNTNNVTEYLKNAYELFEKGKRGLKLPNEHKNITLLLGPTGSGKSTFAHLVFTDAQSVKSVETAGGDFIMDDGDVNIGSSLINSKTITPIFFVDTRDSRIVITACDLGGFGDTRDMSHDLAVNLLIKAVSDFADSVKMIFFISYPFVRPQEDKASFLNLLRHITDFVKDINKFRNGIALIVTKVDNIWQKKGNTYMLKDDKTVINGIAQFLAQTKQELKENQKSGVGKNKNYIDNAINIIDILLTQNAGIFTRIKLFRRPEECGPLSTSTLCQDVRKSFFEIFHSTSYVEKDNDDFGYCLSTDSINVANEIVKEIDQRISSILKKISFIVQDYLQNIETNICMVIKSIMFDTSDVEVHCTNAKTLASEFRNAMNVIRMLAGEVKKKTNIKNVIEIVRKRINDLSNRLLSENENDLINQEKHLDFLQIACKREWSMGPYDGIFNNILLFVKTLENHLQKYIGECVRETEVHLKSALEGLKTAIEREYAKQMKTLGPESVLRMLKNEKLIFSAMLHKIPVVKGTKEQIETFCSMENYLSIRFPEDIRNRILNLKERFLCFENISEKDIDLSFHCIVTLQAIEKCIQESQRWYEYLKDLHANGSQHQIQRDKDIYNVKSLTDWGNPEAKKGICITPENYKLFLEKVSSLSLAESSLVKNLELTEPRQEELNHILDLIFKNEMKDSMTETSVTVQGDYISLKSLFSSEHNPHLINGTDSLLTILSNSKIKTVRFFAFHTIFIDHDIDLVGKKISLMFIAPKWEVIGTRKIDLGGKVGDEPPTDYPGASADSNKANDGAPGNPGGPGGNFFGIGETFINGENLTISANGGKGGAGQKGQAGKKGRNAVLNGKDTAINVGKYLPYSAVALTAIFGFFFGPGAVAVPKVLSLGLTSAQSIASFIMKSYPIMLEEGGTGQCGGSGGKGGSGGSEGKISILELNGKSEIIRCESKGLDGCDGDGGPGGQNGRNKFFSGNIFGLYVELVESEIYSSDGSPGGNLTGRKTPDKPLTVDQVDRVMIEYETLLKEILSDGFRKHYLEQFVALFHKYSSCQLKIIK